MTQAREVRTTCPYCGVGCGVLAKVAADGAVTVRGDPLHPANFGRLCSKGSALAEIIDLDGRLLHPEIGGKRTNWDDALDLVASKFSQAIEKHGSDSVAFYVSGQLLTEDYYLANKLMKGFIGSANIDTNSRLCMSSSVAGHRRAFGSDTVPGTYEDLEKADLVVLVGSNLAWCHPVLYQRIVAAKDKRPGMKIVVIDPRRTMTADIAEMHLAIAPDGDVALFSGLLGYLAAKDRLNRDYIAAHTNGFDEALAAAPSLADVAAWTELSPETLSAFYALFAASEKTVTVYSQGVNQSVSGTDKVNAIINCHLATGRIGKPGAGPFSITGQPNAMGGREVGGLANMLAAHMDIENSEHRDRVQRFWASPAIAEKPGLKAVDLFRAVGDGRIKALWIMATNPVDSMPEADAVQAALAACPFVVVSDVLARTDTARHAHVRLPAAGWGEKDGTVTNSERRISRQRAFLPLPGEARPDWRIIADVARRMGFAEAFDHQHQAAVFAEHAALSDFENGGARDFDIGRYAGIDAEAYEAMQPFQWPARPEGRESIRFFDNGHFYTPDRKARFIAVRAHEKAAPNPAYPLTLNTGRIRDHWHTMTRTGKSPRLSQHIAEPFAEIHPLDAALHGIADADLVRLESPHGSVVVRALVTMRQRRGSVFAPMHWTDQFASNARIDTLAPAVVDPISGQPASKKIDIRMHKLAASAFGFAVMRERPETIDADYWAIAKCTSGWRVELAFTEARKDWVGFASSLLQMPEDADRLAYQDQSAGRFRLAAFDGPILKGALFIAPEPVAVSRAWAAEQLSATHENQPQRFRVVAGRAGADRPDPGATVCSCFSVGVNQITAAIASGCSTVEAIGQTLKAGTNCGSCRSEIKGIIDANRLQAAE
ncbi:nitrate reductase [Oryzicola mucosus]|uniref:Nitrate reductase n=1 Tax=Oryzicola mucosus TaxID=2767425 RepID=A0A8J6U237_9HYPH|nr:nitrate reductase [Oryzicola mucosus]MBD0415378.1 nitrate reductase [Oryzicola mucosus]